MVLARFRGLSVTVAGAVLMLYGLLGCSPRDEVALPRSTATPRASPRSVHTPTPSVRDIVVQTYTAYWPVGIRASQVSLSEARQMLKPYATNDYLDHLMAGIRALGRQGREAWGRVIVHVTSVRVRGRSARVTDCQDTSGLGLADSRSHRLIKGTTGKAHTHVQTDLIQGADAQWKVIQLIVLESACTPEPSAS
jgi:hypothetical protein